MLTVIRSGRFYFWPIIAANCVTMTIALGERPTKAMVFSLVISCLSSFGFLLNDLWDRRVDLVNRAGHFEKADKATISIGVLACMVFLSLASVISFELGIAEFRITILIAVSLIAYTVLLRRVLLIPTVLAALLATSPLWIPLVLWGRGVDKWKWLFICAVVALVAAREIFMDARDRLGDIAGQRDTFATIFGSQIAKSVGILLTIGASVPFLIVVLSTAPMLSMFNAVASITVAALILYLLLSSGAATLGERDDRIAIQNYVFRSRIGMALLPVLILLLW